MNPRLEKSFFPLPPHIKGMGYIDADGNAYIDPFMVRTIGIENIADVIEHRITAAVNSVAHLVRFRNGGELFYIFNLRGEIVELTTTDLACTLSPDGAHIFRMPCA
jgi:hypothetical protein